MVKEVNDVINQYKECYELKAMYRLGLGSPSFASTRCQDATNLLKFMQRRLRNFTGSSFFTKILILHQDFIYD